MSAVILTFIGSIVCGGLAFIFLGERWQLDTQPEQNGLKNFIAFCLMALPIVFLLVFFGLGGLP